MNILNKQRKIWIQRAVAVRDCALTLKGSIRTMPHSALLKDKVEELDWDEIRRGKHYRCKGWNADGKRCYPCGHFNDVLGGCCLGKLPLSGGCSKRIR